ncbi:hypothetical protein BB558_003851 [Smittium angustum]|uniref:Alanine--tRNA ligase n=1 Tax=Smittium angustum TaxID=133377 RepID=A0A2U1J4U3_SMIAN|nr:hypothetical protein BB558_003851 [Smittium angustum]
MLTSRQIFRLSRKCTNQLQTFRLNKSFIRNIVYLSSKDIRNKFIEYFESNGHKHEPSAPLVPKNDPSLLFTNAGMVQFKNYFVNPEIAPHKRVTTIQQCIRAGGKHNDLDDVGKSPRHHTFFEMLGNFSFGSYDKEQAIKFSWIFLTEKLELTKDRLRITVLEGDTETSNIWMRVAGLEKSQIIEMPKEDNFWSMGNDEGPCGTCTEIFWDMKRSDIPKDDENQWVEIWNIVFIDYWMNRNNQLRKLDTPCIDTGMGLERLASVLQNKTNNFDTDEFVYIIDGIKRTLSELGFTKNQREHNEKKITEHLRIIADHVRSSSLLISQGVFPSNTGRGYVLRRIIRRAIRSGYQLGASEGLIPSIFPFVEECLGSFYNSLVDHRDVIINTLRSEESAFLSTLERGLGVLDRELSKNLSKNLDIKTVFELYDTHGLPPDLTQIIAAEKGVSFDMKEFDKILEKTKEKSRETWNSKQKKSSEEQQKLDIFVEKCKKEGITSKFTGYTFPLDSRSSEQSEIISNDVTKSTIVSSSWISKDKLAIVLNNCPFYGFGGGQLPDKGLIKSSSDNNQTYTVENVTSVLENLHIIIAKPVNKEHTLENGEISELPKGDVICILDKAYRRGLTIHHTATHLLQAALRKVLGKHVVQAGSSVEQNKLRFDFTNKSKVTDEQLETIQNIVNEWALGDCPISTHITSLEMAKNVDGALGEFESTYGKLSNVRVVSVSKPKSFLAEEITENNVKETISNELCAGTHLKSTLNIYPFVILSETSIGSGTRRIEAIAGESASKYLMNLNSDLQKTGFLVENHSKLYSSTKNESSKESNIELQKLETSLPKTRIKPDLIFTEIAKSLKAKVNFESKVESWINIGATMIPDIHTHKLCLFQSQRNNISDLDTHSEYNKDNSTITLNIHLMPNNSNPKITSWAESRAKVLSTNDPDSIYLVVQDDTIVIKVGDNLEQKYPNHDVVHAGKLFKKIRPSINAKGGGQLGIAKGVLNQKLDSYDSSSFNDFIKKIEKSLI